MHEHRVEEGRLEPQISMGASDGSTLAGYRKRFRHRQDGWGPQWGRFGAFGHKRPDKSVQFRENCCAEVAVGH